MSYKQCSGPKQVLLMKMNQQKFEKELSHFQLGNSKKVFPLAISVDELGL